MGRRDPNQIFPETKERAFFTFFKQQWNELESWVTKLTLKCLANRENTSGLSL